MIRCLVVDDEEYAAKIIADYIGKVPTLALVGITTSAIDALARVKSDDIDLVFLDIQMPDITGIQFLQLYGNSCKVILTTAYPEFAIDGFEHNVVDYLLKPIAFDRFLRAVQKVAPALGNTSRPDKNDSKPGGEYLFVKGGSKNKFIKITYNDVLYVEGMKNYVSIVTKEQRVITYQSLIDFESQLPQPPFYRVHKSYIVSIDKIKVVDGNIIHIHDQQIPISDTYKDAFFNIIRINK